MHIVNHIWTQRLIKIMSLHSIKARLLLMAVMTTLLTTLLTTIVIFFSYINMSFEVNIRDYYRMVGSDVILAWQLNDPTLLDVWEAEVQIQAMVIQSSDHVTFTYGAVSCQTGQRVQNCFGNPLTVPISGQSTQQDGIEWHLFRQPLRDGSTALIWIDIDETIITDTIEPLSIWNLAFVGSEALGSLGPVALGVIPVAFVMVTITAQPLARRLQRISETSQAFAAGNFMARTQETKRDEIGQLGQQFDSMATTISNQVQELRRLAEQNAELALVAEENVREAERAALARDLHDSVSQHLFSLAMGTAHLAPLIERNPQQATQQAAQLAEMASQAQDELRAVLLWLRPHTLIKQDIQTALTELIQTWQKQHAVTVQMDFHCDSFALPIVLQNVLYRICQEGLSNIARHAQAQSVKFTLYQDATTLYVEITDDGCGFDTQLSYSGLGLIGIQERVHAMSGTFQVTSTSGMGTTLNITLPIIQ